MKVILTHNVDDYGVKGQIVSFPAIDVQRDLILPGFAVYHNEVRENVGSGRKSWRQGYVFSSGVIFFPIPFYGESFFPSRFSNFLVADEIFCY